jgi:hypothetical protein
LYRNKSIIMSILSSMMICLGLTAAFCSFKITKKCAYLS